MSLNWKEINLVLEELELPGMQIQKAIQSAFDLLCFKLYGKNGGKNLLISLSPGACRLHETFDSIPKNPKPLRFAEFLNSKIVNSRILEAEQLGDDRIVRLTLRKHDEEEKHFFVYLRLWSNAANVIVTDAEGKILDAMRRLPKKGEVSGGLYAPECRASFSEKYSIRSFPEDLLAGLSENASFNEKLDALYRREGGALSLEALQEEAQRKFEGNIDRLRANIERLKEQEKVFLGAEQWKEQGDKILSGLGQIKDKTKILEAKSFYEKYKKAKSGLAEIQDRIEELELSLLRQEEILKKLLAETNPLVLHKHLKSGGVRQEKELKTKQPGLRFKRADWLIIVGRDAAESDALLRKHVKGNDLWLHARDYAGSHVFIKNRPGKSVPLDILLDAGNLALYHSKGRASGKGDLFYTQVKYLRRAKGSSRKPAPKGLVIPTQEKNLAINLDSKRLKKLEDYRV